ncbi:MAG: DUF5036 family protein [Bacteroidales bacterium]|nr:DUF5036 family protein [Bacteroidales bacterium]
MKHSFLKWVLMAALMLPLAACADKDPFDIPDDMVVLNMMDEDHGHTRMGLTDIYIDRDMNFRSEQYQFIEVMKARDLGHVEENEPELNTLTDKAAVEQYGGYLAILPGDVLRFPSGRLAIPIDRPYYRIWVDDFICEGRKDVGAIVNFAQYMPVQGGLPKAYTEVGAVGENAPLHVDISAKNCEGLIEAPYDQYFECDVTGAAKNFTQLRVQLRPGALQQMPADLRQRTFHLCVRLDRAATILNFQVK